MYQSRSFYRGYRAQLAKIKAATASDCACDLTICAKLSTRLSGAARYYQLGIEAAILDAFGC